MTKEWKNSVICKGNTISPEKLGLVGISTIPLLALPFMDGCNEVTRHYEARTATNGGLLVVRSQTTIEAAINSVFRPDSSIVEVGFDPQKDLIESVLTMSGQFVVDGKLTLHNSRIETIRQIAAKKGIKRIVSHQQDTRLSALANKLDLTIKEAPEIFKTHATKSGFNKALRDYFGGVGVAGPLGIVFTAKGDILKEYKRLTAKKVGAIVKFDYSGNNMVMSGTENPLVLEAGLSDAEILTRINKFIERENISVFSGEIQMYIPEHVIVSISSGTDEKGEVVAYESHIQTQLNGAADGGMPLRENKVIYDIFENVWPHIVMLYKKLGMTGGQNINLLVMPPEMREIAQSLYGENIGPAVAIDCNYRPISGTLNAMARLQEETKQEVNLANFRSRSMQISKEISHNLHLLFCMASQCGLKSGLGGNFSVIRVSGIENSKQDQDTKQKVHVIANGSDTLNANKALDELEVLLTNFEKISELRRRLGVYPQEALPDRDSYTNFLRNSLTFS